jgi:hypothetical protein
MMNNLSGNRTASDSEPLYLSLIIQQTHVTDVRYSTKQILTVIIKSAVCPTVQVSGAHNHSVSARETKVIPK